MKNVMEYKGYLAKIQYSTEDEVLFGKLQGIADSITFEGTSVSELKAAFHEAVDDYLDMCSRYGKEPEKPYKGSFNVRISPELHKKISLNAMRMGISLNQYVELSLQKNINGDYERIQNISDNLEKTANAISKRIHSSTASMWSSDIITHQTYKRTFAKGVAKQ